MRTSKPFDIPSLILDLLICSGVFVVVGMFSIVISIAVTGSREEGLGVSAFVGLPLVTLAFFFLRRQQRLLVTLIQLLIAIKLIIAWFFLLVHYGDYLSEDLDTWIILGSIPVVLTLIKHTLDAVSNFISLRVGR